MDWNENRTPYDILGIAADATDEQIRKAYKTLALKKHPDKNKNNPAAAVEFQELETAYRALTDGSVKEALDSFLRAKLEREARYSRQDEKRRKMREDLARKEKEVVGGRREEDTARSRLQAELARLRRKMEEEQIATAVKAREATEAVAAASKGQPASAQPDEATQSQLERTLKVVWDANIRDYRPEELRQIFAVHGFVEDVVIRSSKKKRQVSALVVMGTKDAADAAIGSVNGDRDAPLLVMPLLKVPPPESASTGTEPRTSPTPPLHTSTSTSGSQQPSTTTGARSFPIPAPNTASSSGQQPTPSFPIHTAQGSNGAARTNTGAGPGPSAGAAPAAPPGGNSAASIFGSFPGVGGAGGPPGGVGRGVGGSGLEATILEKMKRAAERDRMLREAKEQEDGKAGGS